MIRDGILRTGRVLAQAQGWAAAASTASATSPDMGRADGQQAFARSLTTMADAARAFAGATVPIEAPDAAFRTFTPG